MPTRSSGSISSSSTMHRCTHSSPRSKVNWSSAPRSTVPATVVSARSSQDPIGPTPEPDSSSPVSGSVTSRPSGRVNTDRCDRSQRAKASLIASASSAKVCDGPTAKVLPGHGQNSSPRPPSSSTVTDNHVRVMLPRLGPLS